MERLTRWSRAAARWAGLAAVSVAVALAFDAVHLPAAFLFGPLVTAMAARLAGLRFTLIRPVAQGSQALIGGLIGAALTPAIVATFLADWPILTAIVAATILFASITGWALSRFGVVPGTTGVWGSAPGAASGMVIQAEGNGGDVRLVAFMQYLRVVFVASLATLVAHFGGHDGAAPPPHAWFEPVPVLPLAAMLAIGVLSGLVGQRLRVPAGAFLVPFAIASVLNSAGTVTIVLPQWLLVAAFTLLGWNIGLGFTRAILLHARRALLPTVVSIIALISFSGLLAGLLILVLGVDPLTAYLATSPGGLDSIAVIAASSKVDIAFVMTLQTARLILVTLIGPWLARFMADRS